MRAGGPYGGHSNGTNEYRQRSRSPSRGRAMAAFRKEGSANIGEPMATGNYGYNGSKARIVWPSEDMNAPLVSFRAFMLLQDDTIGPDVARVEYDKYKSEYEAFHVNEFYERNKHLAYFIERYHPNVMELQYKKQCIRSQMNAEIFGEMLKNEQLIAVKWALTANIPPVHYEAPEQNLLAWKTWSDTLEYVLENGFHSPLYLRMPLENCLQFDNIGETITKWDIADAVKALPGLVDVFVTENLSGPRTAWCCFYNTENKMAALEFVRSTPPIIDSTPMNVIIPEVPEVILLGVTPPIMAHPQRILEDIEKSYLLILKYNKIYNSTGSPEMGSDANANLDTISALFDDIPDPMERLDLQLFYLRTVHNICYYSAEHFSDELQPWKRRCAFFIRPDIEVDGSMSMASAEQKAWMTQFDVKLKKLIDSTVAIPEKITEATPAVKDEWATYCTNNTVKLNVGTYRCGLCQKNFVLAENVERHITRKHESLQVNIIKTVARNRMKQEYMNDPHKPLSLPLRMEEMDVPYNYHAIPPSPLPVHYDGIPAPPFRYPRPPHGHETFYDKLGAPPFVHSGHQGPIMAPPAAKNARFPPTSLPSYQPRGPVETTRRVLKPYHDLDDLSVVTKQAVREGSSRPLVSYDDL